ncbi:MAG: YgaP family membrane protein [Candidatus Poseidoniaceae archaeon]
MRNVGGTERIARAAFGSGIVVADFLASVQIELVFLVIGLWGVFTSAFGYCPFNGLLNRNTCQIDTSAAKA